jgi:hypothetical protein
MPSENEGKRNPLVRQRMHVQGLLPAPAWETVDMLVGFSDGGASDGGLYLEEEKTTHPDQIPLLAFRQFDDDGALYGEVWFQPPDLPTLIAALTEQLHPNYSRGTRRWRGAPDGPGGPMLNMG